MSFANIFIVYRKELMDAMRDRLDESELASGADRLRARELRRRAALPLLSLFSKDAEKVGDSAPDPAP